MTTLAQWLTADRSRLTEALRRRPDAALGSSRRDVAEIARRLESPESLIALIQQLPTPHLQVTETVAAMGLGATRGELTALLHSTDPDHVQLVSAVLDDLADCAVVWPSSDGHLRFAGGVDELWPFPLGLSLSARELMEQLNVHELRQIAVCQGLREPPARRADLELAIVRTLSDPNWVRDQVAAAPAEIAAPILALAQPAADEAELMDEDEFFYQLNRAGRGSRLPEAFLAKQTAYQWAAGLGLLLGRRYSQDWQMPAEVGLALRGDGYRAPFTPRRPPLALRPADPAAVTASATAAATEFHQQALAVLDLIARTPLPTAKSGGLAVRDLARLAKTAVVDPAAARLALELAAGAGLLTTRGGRVEPTKAFVTWRAAEAPLRYAQLLVTWWHMPFAASDSLTPDGKVARPLLRVASHANGELARSAVMTALDDLPAGTAVDLESFEECLLWDRPILAHLLPVSRKPWRSAWLEAEALGLIATGALTELGRAVPRSQPADLVGLVTGLLPASSDSAIFGSDLTVMVVGSPTARVSQLLDSTAVRESRGAAITWRFTSTSLRQAMDAGVPAERLETALTSISTNGLPQPLRYLLHDLARRHGEFRLSSAQCIVRSDDVPRLAEAAVDRGLQQLGLRLVAPTVLSSQRPLDETMAALRKAGYLPMPEQS